MALTLGTPVTSAKLGAGIITKIITRSSGYVQVDYNGVLRNEMAFNLADASGKPLKAKPQSTTSGMSAGDKKRFNDAKSIEAFNKQSNLEKWKQRILRVNGLVQGDRNSLGWQLLDEAMSGVYNHASEAGNTFITDVITSVSKFMKASEKQAYVIAQYADNNNITY